MEDIRIPVMGYEGLYDITKSGKIYSYSRQKFNERCDDEYGYHIVKLTKNNELLNYNLYELWKKHFPNEDDKEFKGALKIKYGTGCVLSKKSGVHFQN